ncbi:MgtC/SapB family protein [Curtobacterium sp. RRHDQ10]|uniref:MgtC/SapB family protein n=1 Tax=Curtobacterium phyllosphaerae TaxID=3413379 RepID=UPI003BF2228F
MLVAAAHLDVLEGQGPVQIGELLLAFALSSLIGLERQIRGKSAGLRTQAIVGTTAALMLIVSKYGFFDVIRDGVSFDPSRVAAQIVSGVGFLGAGLILTRQGAVRGLTTAAAVWETAAIGMAAGAGLWLLALVVTALHFLITYGYTAVTRRLPGGHDSAVQMRITYRDGGGHLRSILDSLTSGGWRVSRVRTADELRPDESAPADGVRLATVLVSMNGGETVPALLARVGALDGVTEVAPVDDDELD